MDVTVEKLPQSRARIAITLPWEEWKGELEHAAEHLAAETKVPGFRPGKIPRAMLEQRLGKGALLSEAAEHAVSHAYVRALTEKKIAAIGEPKANLEKVAEGEPLSFSLETDVLPEVVLGDWKKAVAKENEAGKKALAAVSVGDEEITAEIERLAKMRAKFVTVNRAAAQDDNVEIDFTVTKDGAVIEGGKSEKHPIVIGSGAFIPGFEEALVGMKEGEEKTFTLSFPKEYHATHLAGAPAEFAVKMRLVQERLIPVVDDAFAQSLGNFQNLAELRDKLRENMLEEKRTKKEEDLKNRVLDILVGMTTVELPAILIRSEEERMLHEFESQAALMGASLDEYLAGMKKTKDDLKKEWAEQAKKRITAELLLEHLADEQAIEVEAAEIEEAMNRTLQYYKRTKDVEKEIDMERLYTATRGRLRTEKVLTWLMNI